MRFQPLRAAVITSETEKERDNRFRGCVRVHVRVRMKPERERECEMKILIGVVTPAPVSANISNYLTVWRQRRKHLVSVVRAYV